MLGTFVSDEYVQRLRTQAAQADVKWLQLPDEDMRAGYNRKAFLVRHELPRHPQFSFDELFALCRRMPETKVKVRTGIVPIDTDFDQSLVAFNHGMRLDDAITHLVERQAYIVVNNPEHDAQYRPIIEGLLGEIACATQAMDPGINWYSTYLFISAQGAVTPYHMDREMNFLLQVRGTKTAQLWDPRDPVVMSSAQRDMLLADRSEPRPPYHDALAVRAQVFELKPGLGVHHPFIAPHLVTTGPEPSISLAITFRTHRSDIWTDAHCLNQRLRQLRWRPKPVGDSASRDAAKARAIRLLRKVARVFR